MASSKSSLTSQAASLGIPMQIQIDDGTRYSYCDAHMATLNSIEGTRAFYSGECNNGHTYEMDYDIEELKSRAHIENDEIVFGESKGFKSKGLEEY